MIHRLTLAWPGRLPRPERETGALRLLAVPGETGAALVPLDGILGCGDLEPDCLAFLADAFCVPLLYVRGNHDRGANWRAGAPRLPRVLGARVERLAGLPVCGLSWPGDSHGRRGGRLGCDAPGQRARRGAARTACPRSPGRYDPRIRSGDGGGGR